MKWNWRGKIFLGSWKENYPKNVFVTHDGHIFYSQIEILDSNHQSLNRILRDVKNSSQTQVFLFKNIPVLLRGQLLGRTRGIMITVVIWNYWDLYCVETMYSEVNWNLAWNFPVDNRDVRESSQCKSGFDGSFRVGGVTSEFKKEGSIKRLFLVFRRWIIKFRGF